MLVSIRLFTQNWGCVMLKNPNHPKKGASLRVDPIRDLEKIEAIRKMLLKNPMYYCLFVLGINTNLRASDMVRLTAGQVRGVKPMGDLHLKERKTGKHRQITLNGTCVMSIDYLLMQREYRDSDPLFWGQRGPIRANSINRLVKQWCRAVGLKGNYGAHSLRKTFGYHQFNTFKVPLPLLMMSFNHSTQRQTCNYLGIQPEELKSIYANEL